MTSPDNPYFKVSSSSERASRSEPGKFGPVKETYKSKTDFKDLIEGEEQEPETFEELQKAKGSKKGKIAQVSSRSKATDTPNQNFSIFDPPTQKKIGKPAKGVAQGDEAEAEAGLELMRTELPEKGNAGDEDRPRNSVLEMIANADATPKEKAPPPPTPTDLFKEISHPDTHVETKSSLKVKHTEKTNFVVETPDLSSIPTLAVQPQQQINPSALSSTPAPPVNKNLQQIIDQIIDNIYTLKAEGRTETLVTLKQPPLFEGARITLTSFDTAKGEFNITFDNLTQAAKNVLDMQSNQDSLRLGLEKKGYFVHIVTTTTVALDNPIAAALQEAEKQGRENQQGFFGQQQQQEQEQEEE